MADVPRDPMTGQPLPGKPQTYAPIGLQPAPKPAAPAEPPKPPVINPPAPAPAVRPSLPPIQSSPPPITPRPVPPPLFAPPTQTKPVIPASLPATPGPSPAPAVPKPALPPVPAPSPAITPAPAPKPPISVPPPMNAPAPMPVKPLVSPPGPSVPPAQPAAGKEVQFSTTLPSRAQGLPPVPAPMNVRPTQNTTEQPKPPINAPKPVVVGQPKEYNTSIRTMSDDISKIKIGQQPSGITIQKTISPEAPAEPKPAPGAAPVPAKPSMIAPPRPVFTPGALPPITFKAPAPGALPPASGAAPAPKPLISVPGTSIKVPGGGGLPSLPSLPSAPQIPGARSMLRVVLIAVPVLLLLGGGIFGYMYFMGTEETPLPSESPTASAEPTATPQTSYLDDLFSLNTIAVPVVASANPISDFYGLIDKVSVNPKQFKKVAPDGESTALGLIDLLERFLVSYPTDLKNVTTGEKIVLLFGQTEGFDGNGVAATLPTPEKRFVYITGINDQNAAAQIISGWESGMARDLAALFGFNAANAAMPNFSESTYNGKVIRYMNFRYPDRSIDYSFVSVGNGNTYLVISNSRESMYSVLDVLR